MAVATPRDPDARGCQLSVSCDAARALAARLRSEHGVVCDFREPDVLRFARFPSTARTRTAAALPSRSSTCSSGDEEASRRAPRRARPCRVRAQAQALVLAGLVPGHAKAGEQVDENAELAVARPPPFVSRGGREARARARRLRARRDPAPTASTSAPPPAASRTACSSAAPRASSRSTWATASCTRAAGRSTRDRARADERALARLAPVRARARHVDVSFIIASRGSAAGARPAPARLAARSSRQAPVRGRPRRRRRRASSATRRYSGGCCTRSPRRLCGLRRVAGVVDSGLPGPKGNREFFLHLVHRPEPAFPPSSTPGSTPPSASSSAAPPSSRTATAERIAPALARLEAVAATRTWSSSFRRTRSRSTTGAGAARARRRRPRRVLGGDGTILRALRRFSGRVRRSASTSAASASSRRSGRDELELGLSRVFAGEYSDLQLPTLEVELRRRSVHAVNDVVAASATLGRMVELSWSIGGEDLGRVAVRRRDLSLPRPARRPTTSRTAARCSSGDSTRSPSRSSHRTRSTRARSSFRGASTSRTNDNAGRPRDACSSTASRSARWRPVSRVVVRLGDGTACSRHSRT